MLRFTRTRNVAAGVMLLLLMLLVFAMGALAAAGENPAEKLDTIRRIISERGEYDLAEGQLRPFIEQNRGRPVAAEALVLLGYCQDKQKKNEAAAESYSRVLAEYSDAPAALRADAALGAADAWFRLQNYREAIKNYTAVLDLGGRPEQAEAALLWRGEARYRLAMAEQEAGRETGDLLREAAADFTSFMERHPDSKLFASAVSGAAFACFDAGDYERALRFFQKFVDDFSDDRRADECLYYKGECLYRLNRYDEAKTVFQDVVRKDRSGPYAADARAGEAWADYGLRDIARAATGFEQAAELAGDDKEQALSFMYDAGCAWREAGDINKAGKAFQEVAKEKGHELYGLAWLRLGTLWQEQARTAREKAENASLPAEKEKFNAIRKDYGEKAVLYFRNALVGGGLGEEEIEALSLMGEVLLDSERYEEAAKAFAEVAARWGMSERAPWALYHQALAERELSQAAASDVDKKKHFADAAAALRKSLTHPQAKTRLQAAWALADYLSLLNNQDGSRELYRWLASEGVAWARAWRNADGAGDPALEARAREYAADSLFRLGESYYFAGDYPCASGFYQEIGNSHASTPQAAMAMLRLGEIAEAARDAATARSRYEDTLNLGMRLGKNRVGTMIGYAQLRLGTLLLRVGQKEPVAEMRRRILQESSRNLAAVLSDPPEGLNLGRPYYYLAEAKYSLDLKKEALADYENSIKADAKGELADAAWFGVAWSKRDLSDNKGALEAARKVVDDFPDSAVRPDAFAFIASIRRAEGDATDALVDLERFLSEYPKHSLSPKAELERASALDEIGKHAEAADAFQKFLRDNPDHPDVPQALYQRSWALWNRIRPKVQQVREAESRLRDLSGGRRVEELPLADRDEAAKAEEEVRSLSAEVKKAEDEILAALRDLTERYPYYPVVDAAWLRIGEILYDREEYQQALVAYQKAQEAATARKSDMADKAQYRMAWSIQRLAEAAEKLSLEEGEKTRREAARKDMWDKRVAAIDAFESIIGRYPKSDLVGDACFRAAELRRRSGQDNVDPAKRAAWFEHAVSRYRQALEKGGSDAPYRQAAEYGEGLCLLLNGQSTEALKVFQRILLTPDGPYVQDAYWGLGQANLNLGAYANAASAFEQALAADKGTETAAKSLYGIGLTASMAGDHAAARTNFLTVDLNYPHYPEWAAAALVRAARSALADGFRDKAISDLERVLARYGDSPAAEEARELQAEIASGEE